MKIDRKKVREARKTLSFNEYDLERINRLLQQSGGEMAVLLYDLCMTGLDAAEQEIKSGANNKRRSPSDFGSRTAA